MVPLLPLETLAPAAGGVTGRCTRDQGPGKRSLRLVMPHSGQLYLLCLSSPLPHTTLPGPGLLQPAAVSSVGLGVVFVAGDLPALGSQSGVIFWSSLFAVEPPWHFREGDLR